MDLLTLLVGLIVLGLILLVIERVLVHRTLKKITKTANEQAAILYGIIQKDTPNKP